MKACPRVIAAHGPHEAAVEETFVNRDPQSALKLGQARGIALVVPALAGLSVAEYAANLVKKTVVGVGHADKKQVQAMIRVLLPKAETNLGGCGGRARGRDLPCPASRHEGAGRADARGWLKRTAGEDGDDDRQAQGPDRFLWRGPRHPRRAGRRLCRAVLVAHAAAPAQARRGGGALDRDPCPRGRDPPLRLPVRRRARLVPADAGGAGRRRQGRARHPLDARARQRSPPPSPPTTRRRSRARPASAPSWRSASAPSSRTRRRPSAISIPASRSLPARWRTGSCRSRSPTRSRRSPISAIRRRRPWRPSPRPRKAAGEGAGTAQLIKLGLKELAK